MLLPPSQRVRVVARSSQVDWARECSSFDGAIALKHHARGSVWRATLDGHDCVLKCLRLDSPRRRLQSLLHVSPAWRHWRQARWLRSHGFSTAEPLAIVRGLREGERVECLVLQYLPGKTVLEHLASGDLPVQSQHRTAEAVAGLACRLASEKRYNRDAKPSNLIVTSPHETGVHLAVIDCADLRPCPRDDEAAIVRMLTSAILEPSGCGCPPRRSLCMRAVLAAGEGLDPAAPRRRSRRLWRLIERAVADHADPKPKDDPLAPGGAV